MAEFVSDSTNNDLMWVNADVCIENAEIAYEDSTEDEDGPVDTVISSGDLGILIDLARYAVATRAAPPAMDREAVEKLVEPWANYHGDLPDYDHPLRPVYESGIEYAVQLLAKELGVDEWERCDGTEEFDGDLGGTLTNIVLEAMPKDKDGDLIHPRDLLSTLSADAIRQGEWDIERAAKVADHYAEEAETHADMTDLGARVEMNWHVRAEALRAVATRIRALATPASHASDGGEA